MAEQVGDFDFFSGSGDATTDGRNILIATTSSPGTLLDEADAGTEFWRYVSVELSNTDSANRLVTIEWGGTGAADIDVIRLFAYEGPRFIRRKRIRDGIQVRAFADAANVVNASVEVDRQRAEQP